MGSPICTTDDDLFYYPLEEQVSGLMSRLDNPATAYDIYQYNSMAFANSPRFGVRGKADNIDTSTYREHYVAIVNKQTSDTVQYVSMEPSGSYEALLPAGDFEFLVIDRSNNELLTSSAVSLDDESPEITMIIKAVQPKEIPRVEQARQLVVDTVWLITILYPFDDYSLSGEYRSFLNQIKDLMNNHPNLNFKIEGHTDAIGPEAYNQKLSVLRAQAVANFSPRGRPCSSVTSAADRHSVNRLASPK